MKLLLTGFEPFGQESVNPSWEAVKAIPDMRAGFVHIPYLPCQVVEKSKQPSMGTETVVLALETILHTLATVNHV